MRSLDVPSSARLKLRHDVSGQCYVVGLRLTRSRACVSQCLLARRQFCFVAGAFIVKKDLDVFGSTVAIRNASAGKDGGWALSCSYFVTVGSLGVWSCGSSTFKDLRVVQSNSASTRVLPGAGSNDLVEHGCLQVQSVLLMVLDLWPAATFRSTPQPRKDMEAGRGGERKMSSTAAPIS